MSEPKFLLIAVNPVTFHDIAVAGEEGKRLWRLGNCQIGKRKTVVNVVFENLNCQIVAKKTQGLRPRIP